MALKAVVDSLDGLEEGLKSLYQQSEDGKFRLVVEGLEDSSGLKSALEKERLAAREAQKQVRELNERFKDIDPEAVRGILAKFADDEEAKLIASGKVDEVLAKRTERMKAAFEKDVQMANDAAKAADERAAKFTARVLENSIRAEASVAGLHQHAIEDALFRAQTTFQLDGEGNPAAVEGAFGKDGKPLTLKEWFGDMKDKAPHWWPATQGGGAGSGTGGGSAKNPWSKDQWNMTEQAQLFRENPARARQLAEQAGVKL